MNGHLTDHQAAPLRKIVSGGQTGVDRAALDAAMGLGLAHGGWCPRGRLAEDGVIPRRYQLRETSAAQYWVRTEQNVIDSDATLILFLDRLQGGSYLTHRMTRKHGRPCLSVDLRAEAHPRPVRDWLREQRVEVLNVAGPRESSSPGLALQAERFLKDVLGPRPES